MRFRERRRLAARLTGVVIPDPFDVDVLAARLAEQRGKPLRFVSMSGPRGESTPCALWIAFDDEDVICVEPATTSWHREQMIVHELAHMICRHVVALEPSTDYTVQRLTPDLDPGLVRLVLGRTSYTTTQEREAETLATMIMGRARRVTTSPAAHPDIAAAVARAATTFGEPGP